MTRWLGGISRLYADTRYSRKFSSTSNPTTSSDSSAGYRVGDVWTNTSSGNQFDCIVNTAGAAVWRPRPRILGQRLTSSSHTGNTDETILGAVISIAAGAVLAGGIVRVTSNWTMTNNANNKTPRAYLGATGAGIGGTAFMAPVIASAGCIVDERIIFFTTTSAQQSNADGATIGGWASGGTQNTMTINAANAMEIAFSGQLANGADTVTLTSASVHLQNPDIGP